MNKNHKNIIKFTKELVAIPSQNGIDLEDAIAKTVFSKLESFGFNPKIIGDKNRSSVICHIKKKSANKTIWLESCLDTAPVGDFSKWKYPPFEGKIVGNKMFGRGSNDSKIAIAIFCYLAKELAKDKNFKSSIFLGFDADEQSGNFSGIREVLKYAPKVEVCILGYQGIKEISIGARGWLRLKITTIGKSAHTGSRSKKGINAIHLMGKAIVAILGIDLGNKKSPFFNFGPSLQISQINGGEAINIVPDRCEANIDIRLLPSQTKKEVISKINKALKVLINEDSLFNFSLEILQFERAYLTNPENTFVKILSKKANKILQKSIPLVASGQGSVGNIISKLNIPIINAFGCECGNGHSSNEWVNIKTVPKVFEIYKKSLKEFAAKK